MSAPNYQSLYRRYRPQRFDQVLGQDHVTKALRNAVREGRVGHAYLFSGPRGTGKTSAARILAKVLNCADPQDGEPCGKCDNCLAVERGQVTDWFLEQDAASKSKVDDMRDLLDRVPLGTSGNRKVIILDEVHMLSQGAENALLKTLEEPPDHVVFVLATTDPQKVRPTIRSRTQHFGFHLLPPDVLEQHIRHVIADAHLGLADDADAVAHVLRVGGGSARDTLSALDQVAALGEVVADTAPVEAILDALAARDPGGVLVAVSGATSTGREPRALGEAIIVRLRDAFLAVLGAGDEQLPEPERARARELGQRIGAAGLTRALEVLGEALMELSRKPDPRVVVEVALVRLARPDTDRSLDAVLERLDRLERALQSGGAPTPPPSGGQETPSATPTPAPAAATPSEPPSTSSPSSSSGNGPTPGGAGGPASAARAALAEKLASKSKPARPASTPPPAEEPPPSASTPTSPVASSPATPAVAATSTAAVAPAPAASEPTVAAAEPTPDPSPAVAATSTATVAPAPAAPEPTVTAPEPAPDPSPAVAATSTTADDAGGVDLAGLTKIWSEVLGELPLPVRSKWRGGSWVTPVTNPARFTVPNAWHQKACEEGRRDVEQALSGRLGPGVTVEVVIEGGEEPTPARPTASAAAATSAPPPADDVESIDLSDLRDAGDTPTGGVDLLLREFGGQLMEEDPQ